MVAAPDTGPTAQSYEVLNDLSARLTRELGRLEAILQHDLEAFNQALADQRVPAVPTRPRRR